MHLITYQILITFNQTSGIPPMELTLETFDRATALALALEKLKSLGIKHTPRAINIL